MTISLGKWDFRVIGRPGNISFEISNQTDDVEATTDGEDSVMC
jgi:hypothetical protein